jgi:hypothetical protein
MSRKADKPMAQLPDLRAMTLKALLKVGGVEYLARQALENPANFLLLLGKVMPKEVHTELTAEVKIRQEVRRDLIDKLLLRILEEERSKQNGKTLEHTPELPLMLEAQASQDRDKLSCRQSGLRLEGAPIVAGAAMRAAAMGSDAALSEHSEQLIAANDAAMDAAAGEHSGTQQGAQRTAA